jgi:mono/diheme cytochrome c family protein
MNDTTRGLGLVLCATAWAPQTQAQDILQLIGEQPTIRTHIDQNDIDRGKYRFDRLFDLGRELFDGRFNFLDGQGRPAATGDGVPTKRVKGSAPDMVRTSAPDATSCAGCHNQPESGGAGDVVANVFVLAQVRGPNTESVKPAVSNERYSLGMHGSGAIEMLAREITAAKHDIRDDALRQAKQSNRPVSRELIAKGVHFGRITAHPNGNVDTSKVEGVDTDLIIKPFHQKGVVNSVRVFTNNAMNHHHGMQSVERFGFARTGTADFDEDGVEDELTAGDITATTVYQAGLQVPARRIPRDLRRVWAILAGEKIFEDIGCASCHVPEMVLDNPIFSEPNPYNGPGNLRVGDVKSPFTFDLTRDIPKPRLEKRPGKHGGAVVRAFTDLKRHIICDDQDPFYRNERLVQGGVPVDQFLTRKLWDVGNTAPYGHRGDLSTITEAIMHHAGAARPQRERFTKLSKLERAAVVEFLKSLQILPAGSPPFVWEK